MFNWLRELLELKYEFREKRLRLLHEVQEDSKKCESCEVLRIALERANFEKDKLLDILLRTEESVKIEQSDPKIAVPKNIPWNMRKQMLEKEDREKARIMRNVPKPDTDKGIEEFEKELKDAESSRSKNSANS